MMKMKKKRKKLSLAYIGTYKDNKKIIIFSFKDK